MPSVVLLDLVNTLISAPNTPAAAMGMTVAHESYRRDLIDALRDWHVIMAAPRAPEHGVRTLAQIERTTGWTPAESLFLSRDLRRTDFLDNVLIRLLSGRFATSDIIAIDDCPDHRPVYARFGVFVVGADGFVHLQRAGAHQISA